MKKLTAGIFTVMLGLCATSGADAAVASKGYVDSFVGKQGSITSTISSLTQTVADNKSAADTAIADAKKAGTDASAALAAYETKNDAAVKAAKDQADKGVTDAAAVNTALGEYKTANNARVEAVEGNVTTLQQDVAKVKDGELTLKDGSVAKAKLTTELQAEIDSFATQTAVEEALALKGDKTDVQKNAQDIAKNAQAIDAEVQARTSADSVLDGKITANTSAITTLNGDETTTGSVAKSIADAFTAARLDQYATKEGLTGALAEYTKTTELKNLAFKDTVGTEQIDNGAVTTAKLADGAVESGKIANGAVTDEKISAVASSKVTGLSESLAEKLTIPTVESETNGKYVLTATSSNGQATYYWELIAREGEQ